jgi:hypothetical protein
MKTDVNVPSKSNKQKNLEKTTRYRTYFLLASCQPLTKKAGLASRIQIRAYPKEIFKNPQKLVVG